MSAAGRRRGIRVASRQYSGYDNATMRLRQFFFFTALLLPALLPAVAHAIVVEPTQIIDGNFSARERVVDLKGVIRHDAFIVGSTVNLSGSIGGDAFVMADTLTLSGTVDGSLRALARTVTIDGVVSKNVAVVGGRVLLNKSSRVGWDVWVHAHDIKTNGTVDGQMMLSASDILINGAVGKTVEVSVPRQGTVSIGSDANIVSDVLFRSPTEGLAIDSKAQVQGRINHDPRSGLLGGRMIALLLLLLGLAVTGAALMSLRPAWLVEPSDRMIRELARTLLVGLGSAALLALLVPLTFFTGVGIGLSGIVLLGLVVGLYLGTLMSVFAFGGVTLKYFSHPLSPFGTLLVGLCIYGVASFVPLVGPLVRAVAAICGLGAITLSLKLRIKNHITF